MQAPNTQATGGRSCVRYHLCGHCFSAATRSRRQGSRCRGFYRSLVSRVVSVFRNQIKWSEHLPETFISSCRLLEKTVLGGAGSTSARDAQDALVDCLLVQFEVADELKLRNTTSVLDIVVDVAMSEVQGQPVPIRTLMSILQLAEAANEAVQKTVPPTFTSRRSVLSLDAKVEQKLM